MVKRTLLLLSLVVIYTGCGDTSCEDEADSYRYRKCSIKVTKKQFNGRWFMIEGTNVTNGHQNKFAGLGRWYPLFSQYIEIGDTVVKHKDELVFYVHKKDTLLTFPYKCGGQIIE
ncbi:hypothetical protein IC229_06825 [Spirosoma sp. BT702]|uniref:Uncharacterized protein n=1 Tax=Spirosoma profusum TaxID=2771354 RepID=A0A926Y1K9_9BACT|nr:hypothetical protein [Spirosoma profusum]MBD2700340.1 hypothetical protein [Spirosoma profusum]